MKKRLIIAISLAAALVLMVGSYFLLQHYLVDNKEPEPEKTISIGIDGYDEYDIATDVKKMTITNLYGTFSFTPDPSVDGIEDKSWFLDDLDGLKSDPFAVNDIALAYYTITATKKLEVSPADYATYGFEGEPEQKVTFEFTDGTVYTYSFGASVGLTSSESDYFIYLMRSGDDAVYLVENYFFDRAFISLKDVMKKELYPQLENNAVITDLTLSGSAGDYLEISSDADNFMSYHIKKPYYRATDMVAMNNLLGELDVIKTNVNIVVAGTKEMQISDYSLHLYGLDAPARILHFKYTIEDVVTASDGTVSKTKTNGEHTLKLGIVYDNIVYVMVDDMNVIYGVPFTLLDSVYGASFDSLAVRNLYTEKLVSIEEMKFDTTFKTFDYKITAATQVTAATLNGKSIEVDVLKNLYTQFASIAYSERTTEKPTAEPYITVTLKLTTGKTDVITFTEFNARRYFVTINGVGDLLVSYELVDDLMEALKTTDKTSLG